MIRRVLALLIGLTLAGCASDLSRAAYDSARTACTLNSRQCTVNPDPQ